MQNLQAKSVGFNFPTGCPSVTQVHHTTSGKFVQHLCGPPIVPWISDAKKARVEDAFEALFGFMGGALTGTVATVSSLQKEFRNRWLCLYLF